MKREQITARRVEMVRQIAMGMPVKSMIDDIAKNYQIPPHTIRKDWDRRNQWIRSIVDLEDNTLAIEIVAGMRQTLSRAWAVYLELEREKDTEMRNAMSGARVGALRMVKETQVDLLRSLQSMGIVKMAPDRLEAKVSIAQGFPFMLDPDIKDLVVEYHEKMKAEKDARLKSAVATPSG